MHKSYVQSSYGQSPFNVNGRSESSGATKPPVLSPYTHLEPKRIIGSGSFGKLQEFIYVRSCILKNLSVKKFNQNILISNFYLYRIRLSGIWQGQQADSSSQEDAKSRWICESRVWGAQQAEGLCQCGEDARYLLLDEWRWQNCSESCFWILPQKFGRSHIRDEETRLCLKGNWSKVSRCSNSNRRHQKLHEVNLNWYGLCSQIRNFTQRLKTREYFDKWQRSRENLRLWISQVPRW